MDSEGVTFQKDDVLFSQGVNLHISAKIDSKIFYDFISFAPIPIFSESIRIYSFLTTELEKIIESLEQEKR